MIDKQKQDAEKQENETKKAIKKIEELVKINEKQSSEQELQTKMFEEKMGEKEIEWKYYMENMMQKYDTMFKDKEKEIYEAKEILRKQEMDKKLEAPSPLLETDKEEKYFIFYIYI